MKLKIVFLYCFILCSYLLTAQTFSEKYDLNFQEVNNCSCDWLKSKVCCKFYYNNELKYNKLPPLQIQFDSSHSKNDMAFEMKKSINLSLFDFEKIEAIFCLENSSDSNLVIKVIGVDANERITFSRTKRISKTSGWKTISLTAASKTTKAINIYIQYKGNQASNQIIGLQGIEIKLDGKSIEGLFSSVKKQKTKPIVLNSEYIVPLSMGKSLNFKNEIPEIKNSKIIGLGENTHGSKSICIARFQMLKTLITTNNCTLILCETPFDLTMMLDLYVQGIISDDSGLIDDYLRLRPDYRPRKEFLNWLRNYNTLNSKKVHFLGIDKSSIGNRNVNLPLFDYLLSLLGEKDVKTYLKALNTRNITEVKEVSIKDKKI